MNVYLKLFKLSFLLLIGVFVCVLAISLGCQYFYTPLDYRLEPTYPLYKWQEHVSRQEGNAKLWGDASRFGEAFPLGAYPAQTGGTVIFQFRYPFPLAEVLIEDQHNQWGDGDLVRRWTSLDGKTWLLHYDDRARGQVVASQMVHQNFFRGKNTVYLKYELYAGDPNRAADDNRGATVRQLRIRATFQPLFMIPWNLLRYGLLPFLALLTLLLLLLATTPALPILEIAGVLVIFIAAAAFRIGFVISPAVWHPPVFSDDYWYNQYAIRLFFFVTNPGTFLQHGTVLDVIRPLYEKGPGHVLFLTVLYVIGGLENYSVIRIAQGLLDAMTGIIVFFIGRSLGGRWAGMIATGLYALYVPFLVSADRLYQETLALFLLTLTISLFLKLPRQPSYLFGFGAGGCLGVTVLCRYALNYIPIPLVLLALFGMFRVKKTFYRQRLLQMTSVLVGLLLTIGVWMFSAGIVFHKVSLTSSMSRYRAWYMVLLNQGWYTDHFAVEDGSPLAQLLQQRHHSVDNSNFDDFRDAFGLAVKTYPGRFLAKALNNLYYYWKIPYNDFWQVETLPLRFQVRCHWLIGLLGLWGVVFSLRLGYRTLIVVFPICYTVLIEMVMQIEARLALLAQPFLIIMSAYTLAFLLKRGTALWRDRQKRVSRLLLIASAGGLYLIANIMTEPKLLEVFRGLSAQNAHRISLLLLDGILLSLAILTYRLLQAVSKRSGWLQCGRMLQLLAFAPSLLVALVYHAHIGMLSEWQEWKVRLDRPQFKIQQRIGLPEKLPEFTEAYLKFDLQGGSGHNYDLVITANGQEIKRYAHGITADPETVTYLQCFDHGFYQNYLRGRKQTPNDLRQWFSAPINPTLLRAKNMLDIELKLENGGGDGHYVDIYGDYPPPQPEIPQLLPAFGLATNKTALYFKGGTGDGDYRLWTLAEIRGGNSCNHAVFSDADAPLTRWQRYLPQAAMESKFFNGAGWSTEDLSSESGRQSGQYRIRVVLKDNAGNFWIL